MPGSGVDCCGVAPYFWHQPGTSDPARMPLDRPYSAWRGGGGAGPGRRDAVARARSVVLAVLSMEVGLLAVTGMILSFVRCRVLLLRVRGEQGL